VWTLATAVAAPSKLSAAIKTIGRAQVLLMASNVHVASVGQHEIPSPTLTAVGLNALVVHYARCAVPV
jgi:hypothetical protein